MIRQAELHELELCCKLGEEFFIESGMPGQFSPEHFVKTWHALITNGFGVIYLLIDASDKIIGGIGGVLFPNTHSGEQVATELFWFVTSTERGMGGLKLFAKFEQWAIEQGAAWIDMACLANQDIESLHNVFIRKGYREMEVHYVKEVNGTACADVG